MQRSAKEKGQLTAIDIQTAHIEQLQWAVKFIRQNLRELRAGEWLTLKEDLYDFMLAAKGFDGLANARLWTTKSGALASFVQYEKARFVKRISLREVEKIQGRMISVFNGVVVRSAVSFGLGANKAILNFHCSSLRSPFELKCFIHGDVQATIIALGVRLVGSLLTQEQFLRCPECGNIFLSIRKPRGDRRFHCSLKCSRTAASRRYRQKPQVRQADRARAMRRYERKIRQRYPKAPIAKRHGSSGDGYSSGTDV